MLCKSTGAGSEGHSGVAVCRPTEAEHPSPRHSVPVSHGTMHVEVMSGQPRKDYNYQTLAKKWRDHLPLCKSGDAKRELMRIFPKLFKGIGSLGGEYHIDFKPDAMSIHLLARNVQEALREPFKQGTG